MTGPFPNTQTVQTVYFRELRRDGGRELETQKLRDHSHKKLKCRKENLRESPSKENHSFLRKSGRRLSHSLNARIRASADRGPFCTALPREKAGPSRTIQWPTAFLFGVTSNLVLFQGQRRKERGEMGKSAKGFGIK